MANTILKSLQILSFSLYYYERKLIMPFKKGKIEITKFSSKSNTLAEIESALRAIPLVEVAVTAMMDKVKEYGREQFELGKYDKTLDCIGRDI
jgi:hypothetical protein